MLIVLIIAAIVAYFGYGYWKDKKAKEEHQRMLEERQEMFEKLTQDYNTAYERGDIQKIQSSANKLINYSFVTQGVLDDVYQQCLNLLKQNPDLKPFVLNVGRKKYSKFRESGSPTVYDESAILNDINAAI